MLIKEKEGVDKLLENLPVRVKEGEALGVVVRADVDLASVAANPKEERRFTQLARPKAPKAAIHTWLAWQEKPGKLLGTAITAKFLDSRVAQVDF
jgi:hypothetical protein